MKRTRWAGRLVGGLLAVASANGCKQQLFVEPSDYAEASQRNTAYLENHPEAPITPGLTPGQPPATVLDASRPPRPIKLAEAIAIALENGGIGGFNPGNPGFGSESLPQFNGRGTNGNDSIRAFALDPATAAAEIERALSKFDARWINSITWNKVDQPVLSLQQSFANGDTAQLNSTLAKPLPTGGVAGITFTTNYQKLSTPPTDNRFVTLNTSYSPAIQFSFEQPLLQGFGVEINQLLPNHPGTQLIQGLRPSGGQGSEGILITRIRLDQQRATFDQFVNQLLFNVEGAYWRLVSGYYSLQAQEEGLKQSLDSYLYYKARADRGLNRPQVALQALAQYYSFARQVITARGEVLERERQLRLLLNLRSDDNTRLVPSDDLILAPYLPDAREAVADAVVYRPDLQIQRQEVKARQLNVLLQKNLRRPDLRLLTNYNVAGLGERLDGNNDTTSPNRNALESLADNRFNSWSIGLRLDMPLGFRDANALVRQAQLQLQQEYVRLQTSEVKVEEQVTSFVRRVVQSHREAELYRAQRTTQQEFVRLDQQIREVGAIGKEEAAAFVLNLIQSQQQLAQSTAAEFDSLANYNIALAGLEFAKGTIQQYNRITVAEGALPAAAGKKAADHFSAREAALKLREHPADGPVLPAFARGPVLSDAQIEGAVKAVPGGYAPPAGFDPEAAKQGKTDPAYDPAANPLGKPAAFGAGPKETAPVPQPATPANPPAPAPAPLPQVPSPVPTPVLPGGVGAGRQRLVPADAPGSFTPVGSVTLPPRPVAAPTVPVAVPLPPTR